MRHLTAVFAATAGAALAAATLAACGGGTPTTAPSTAATGTTTSVKPSPHKHTPGMQMGGGPRTGAAGSPAATGSPAADTVDARRVPGRTLLHGTFVAPAGQAAGTPRVDGSGWLAYGPTGTTVTVELAGLPVGSWFMVHLGTQPCSAGDDSTYAFPAAAGRAAHSLHVMFAPTTAGPTTVTDDDPADTAGAVRSLVLLPESMEGRIACADLA